VCSQSIAITIPLRAGTNAVADPHEATPFGAIGVALNGVAIYNPSAANGSPNGYSRPEGFNFNAGATMLFGEDAAGGHPSAPSGQYHYHSMEFASAWAGTDGVSTVSEVGSIPYLADGLTFPDGHSKILGWAYDVRTAAYYLVGCGCAPCVVEHLPLTLSMDGAPPF
jgi:hypothetical protein